MMDYFYPVNDEKVNHNLHLSDTQNSEAGKASDISISLVLGDIGTILN